MTWVCMTMLLTWSRGKHQLCLLPVYFIHSLLLFTFFFYSHSYLVWLRSLFAHLFLCFLCKLHLMTQIWIRIVKCCMKCSSTTKIQHLMDGRVHFCIKQCTHLVSERGNPMLFLNEYAFLENSFHRHTALTSVMLASCESSQLEQFVSKLWCFLHVNNVFGWSGNRVAAAKWVLMAKLFHLENRERQPSFPGTAYYRVQFGEKIINMLYSSKLEEIKYTVPISLKTVIKSKNIFSHSCCHMCYCRADALLNIAFIKYSSYLLGWPLFEFIFEDSLLVLAKALFCSRKSSRWWHCCL